MRRALVKRPLVRRRRPRGYRGRSFGTGTLRVEKQRHPPSCCFGCFSRVRAWRCRPSFRRLRGLGRYGEWSAVWLPWFFADVASASSSWPSETSRGGRLSSCPEKSSPLLSSWGVGVGVLPALKYLHTRKKEVH